ncbi:MAG: activase [Desulfobacterales bacterium]|nr:activase [Desulfobacterales bacterium]
MDMTRNSNDSTIKVLGICLGASTISLVQLEGPRAETALRDISIQDEIRVIDASVHPHGGNPKDTLYEVLERMDLGRFDHITATGRRFRHFVDLTSIPEPEAVEYAYQFVKPEKIDSPALVSAGGETFMVYILNRHGRISNVMTGNKCASGTGEFFMQQLRRMGVTLEEAAKWSANTEPYAVSGRCSVFCKSDCTHAINKGIPKSRVTAGLCRMMANKILELLKKVERRHIMVVGGTSQNQMMIEYLKKEIPGLIVPKAAPYFEALGTALWALSHETKDCPRLDSLFHSHAASFDTLPPLSEFKDRVTFIASMKKEAPKPGDVCILGLDVGSTTTKAVLFRTSDNAMLASIYGLTAGDPVGASRRCYARILEAIEPHVDPAEVRIIGLGVCGSGRQIAGLHALTDGIINEIIAHAAAAVHFDPDVDTLFEIGGQDAKYTYITAGVPSDYAMNEACSAGTGSFLEESAYETLGIKVDEIADVAMESKNPPNFNDQCAAFISSDIKTAIHEGIDQNDIVAGLVYSICMNYTNRVKGNRPVGEKVFMQGGVCYNYAVPLAMASLSGKPIIVPPEPGLMGAYGVALEIKKRIDLGLMQEHAFDLRELADREVKYCKSFICKGGKEKCDRGCEINVIEINGKKYPFGGACNRYYNLRFNLSYDVTKLDLVKRREELIFEKYAAAWSPSNEVPFKGTVGINKSFLVNTYYPLYATFFSNIGYQPVLASNPSQEGIDQRNAAFCHPAELSHGFFDSLLNVDPPVDFLFLPHVRGIPVENGYPVSQVCPFVQGEPFYLQTTFKQRIDRLKQKGMRLLTPFIDMSEGLDKAKEALVEVAYQMGVARQQAEKAFHKALGQQRQCLEEMKNIGRSVISQLESDPDAMGVVIFSRPYNGMVEEAHMGIPHKLASRGVQVIPMDFLPIDEEPVKDHMYWAMGQLILKAGHYVKRHPQLFGTYITNFSCGPDSFIIGYFRTLMGRKPSLTLELDSHTADAGIETRIEAFLDIVAEYRQLVSRQQLQKSASSFTQAETFMDKGVAKVRTSDGEVLPMTDRRVTFLIPSMGRISTEALAAVFRESGYHVAPHPPADEAVLKLGRANTSCKECLPLILTTGTLLNYIQTRKQPDEVLVYFMPSASGPCRFGQYNVFMRDLIDRLEIENVAIFTLTSDNTYFGMGNGFNYYKAWWAILISDLMEDIRSMMLANAKDTEGAMEIFNEEWALILNALEKGNFDDLSRQLDRSMARFSGISLIRPAEEVPVILLTGEIFVRRDALSRQYLTESLAESGFAVICSPVSEWIRYSDYMMKVDGDWPAMSFFEKLQFYLRQTFMNRYEKRLAAIISKSGLSSGRPARVDHVIDHARPFISKNLGGEAILTVGSSLTEIASEVCGVIAIGPFGCMPNRLSESILSEVMHRDVKLDLASGDGSRLRTMLSDFEDLPFLAIESDGSPFPQLINAKLEAFCQQAERLHRRMTEN